MSHRLLGSRLGSDDGVPIGASPLFEHAIDPISIIRRLSTDIPLVQVGGRLAGGIEGCGSDSDQALDVPNPS